MNVHGGSQYASALSLQGDTQAALEEICRQVLERLEGKPDLAMVFASAEHLDRFEQISEEVRRRLEPSVLLGCSAEAVVGGAQEIEAEPAIALWGARLPGTQLAAMHLHFERTADGSVIHGWPDHLLGGWPAGAALIVLGEPFSFPVDLMLQQLNEDCSEAVVVGGMASGGASPGQNRLMIEGRVVSEGAVAVLLQGSCRVRTVVSQGCRPIGRPLVVTKGEQNVIYELGGRPALLQLKEIFDTLPNQEKELVQRGLHLGRVVNEYQEQFEQGDFLVRNVTGIDPGQGSLAVGDYFRVGQTVQFHIRDHRTASIELRQLLEKAARRAKSPPRAALLFTCNGRGLRFFGTSHHDAGMIHGQLGDIPVAGFFAQGEIGPVGGKNFLHGFTASVALFEDVPKG